MHEEGEGQTFPNMGTQTSRSNAQDLFDTPQRSTTTEERRQGQTEEQITHTYTYTNRSPTIPNFNKDPQETIIWLMERMEQMEQQWIQSERRYEASNRRYEALLDEFMKNREQTKTQLEDKSQQDTPRDRMKQLTATLNAMPKVPNAAGYQEWKTTLEFNLEPYDDLLRESSSRRSQIARIIYQKVRPNFIKDTIATTILQDHTTLLEHIDMMTQHIQQRSQREELLKLFREFFQPIDHQPSARRKQFALARTLYDKLAKLTGQNPATFMQWITAATIHDATPLEVRKDLYREVDTKEDFYRWTGDHIDHASIDDTSSQTTRSKHNTKQQDFKYKTSHATKQRYSRVGCCNNDQSIQQIC